MDSTPVSCAVLEDFFVERAGIKCSESRLLVAVMVRALADMQNSDRAKRCDANRWLHSRIIPRLCDLIELDQSYIGIAEKCLYVQGVRPEEVVC